MFVLFRKLKYLVNDLFRRFPLVGMGVVFVPLPWVPGGVVVLFSCRFLEEICSWKKDSEGRVVSILVSFGSFSCNLVNVYVPTNRLERSTFFLSVHQFFFPRSRIIFGGDLNCYDNVLDKFAGNVSLSLDLFSFKSCFNFVDGWRSKHPRVSQCSWFNSDLSIGSRLDSFLVARDLLNSLLSCEISPCVFSDHDFVTLDVDLSHVFDFRPGVWKFNNSLLKDRIYCALITDLIDQHLSFKHVLVSVKDFWESLKELFVIILLFILKLSKESFRMVEFALQIV